MARPFIPPCLAALILPFASLHAEAPTDEQLLKYVRERTTRLEKFTPQPVDMEALTSTLCRSGFVHDPQNPHGPDKALTYGSSQSALSFFDPIGKFPEGSVILKEKVGDNPAQPKLFTGMVKREKGFYPGCGDWEFFVVDGPATKVEQRGKLERCASCHEDHSKGDFVTRSFASGPFQISGGRIILHASRAQTHGTKLVYEPQENKNTLGYWTEASDWASWNFEVLQPGKYAIHLWQGCGAGSGGSEVELRCAGQTARFQVEDTGGFQNFEERTVGEFHFDQPGRQTLEVRVLSKPGLAVMDLPRIVLEPVRP